MPKHPITRRAFLATSTAITGFNVIAKGHAGDSPKIKRARKLHVGEAHVDITPPMGIELAGFHKPIGQERRIEGIRQNAVIRSLTLHLGTTQAILVSVDILALPIVLTKRIGKAIESRYGIPATNVRLCATHTHSMPSFTYLRQWGAVPHNYMALVEAKILTAIDRALKDAEPATLSIGSSRAIGASFNRTVEESKTDADFTKESTDDERWLDTLLQVLHFERGKKKKPILWYHFASHPVCYNDTQAGPDWPGMVDALVEERFGVTPSFLQGHAGDVNPGDGEHWIGKPEQSANATFAAIVRAMNNRKEVDVNTLTTHSEYFGLPLDLDLYQTWLDQYATDPAACTKGIWVDAPFAQAWYEDNQNRKPADPHHYIQLSTLQLGPIQLAFHPSELFSYYGLQIRHNAPTEHTLVVGYTDGLIGYLTDPASFEKEEYAAVVVPKILDIPPYTRSAASEMTQHLNTMLLKNFR